MDGSGGAPTDPWVTLQLEEVHRRAADEAERAIEGSRLDVVLGEAHATKTAYDRAIKSVALLQQSTDALHSCQSSDIDFLSSRIDAVRESIDSMQGHFSREFNYLLRRLRKLEKAVHGPQFESADEDDDNTGAAADSAASTAAGADHADSDFQFASRPGFT